MGTKIFVGSLSWGTTDQMLNDAFAGFGSISEAKVILDRETGRSRGFGFVTFDSDDAELVRGGTGFGVRLLVDLARSFTA